jgi:hypothetical protein
MGLGRFINRCLAILGLKIVRLPTGQSGSVYDQDGLLTLHNHEFMSDAAFVAAYQRGVTAVGSDYGWHWRVHVGLWAARKAAMLEGDFIECGVNRGFLSAAIMQRLDWNSQGRRFFLLDTFKGLDERFLSEDEKQAGHMEKNAEELRSGFYVSGVDSVKAAFAEWKNSTEFVVGCIPETLEKVDSQSIAYLHIDLNCSPPEVAALRYFWPKLVPGAVVLFDDYAYAGYELQKGPIDAVARELGVQVLSLPTGQGLIVK